jgi:hypothetical protein
VAASIADKQDGTGITATTSGHTTSVLRVARFGGSVAQAAWSTVATLNGNVSNQSVTLAEGAYFAIWQLDGVYQSPVGFRVTDGTAGVHERALREIREFILSLTLPSYPADGAKHKRHKRPIRTMQEFGEPPFGVHYWKLPEQIRPVDNYNVEVTYPVQLVLIASGASNVSDGDWTRSRQIIVQSFTRCPLMDLPEIHTVEISPGEIYAAVDSTQKYDLQSLIFNCKTEMPSVL